MPDQSSAATEHAILQEITAPLERLPADPLATVDADFATTLRGYDRMAVDEYVLQTRHLVAELQATRSPEAAVRRALERVGDQITGILQRAHDTAEQITAQSRSEAEDRLQQARSEAGQLAAAAERRVSELDADTDRIWVERQRIVADAEDLAGQLLALAKLAAERFPNDEDADDAEPPAPTAPRAKEPEREPELDEPDDDVERTVAFAPLEEFEERTAVIGEDDTALLPDHDEPTEPVPPPPGPDAEAPRADRGRLTDDESTNVIRPASQAANRRLGR